MVCYQNASLWTPSLSAEFLTQAATCHIDAEQCTRKCDAKIIQQLVDIKLILPYAFSLLVSTAVVIVCVLCRCSTPTGGQSVGSLSHLMIALSIHQLVRSIDVLISFAPHLSPRSQTSWSHNAKRWPSVLGVMLRQHCKPNYEHTDVRKSTDM